MAIKSFLLAIFLLLPFLIFSLDLLPRFLLAVLLRLEAIVNTLILKLTKIEMAKMVKQEETKVLDEFDWLPKEKGWVH